MSGNNNVTDINNQTEYWNRVAREKEFTHPVNVALLQTYLPVSSRILDYGCGYGRVCRLLADAGYGNVLGVDSSSAMIERGRELHPGLALDVLPAAGLPYPEHSFDAVLLFSVLTCIPTDVGQQTLLKNLKRILRPGGSIYISDLVLQDDERNLERYHQHQKEFGTYGVFRLPEGTVVRHLSTEWIETLTSDFEMLKMISLEVVTMNGHKAKAFQYFGRLG
jgi:SAM-dependent methyltransferase